MSAGPDIVDFVVAGTALVSAIAAWVAVNQARKERGSSVLPMLVLRPETVGDGFVNLRVANVGLGPAIDVDLEINLTPGTERHRLNRTVIPPGESLRLVPEGRLNRRLRDLAAEGVQVRMTGHCENAFETRIDVNDSVALASFASDLADSGELVAEDQLSRVANMLQELVWAMRELTARFSDSR